MDSLLSSSHDYLSFHMLGDSGNNVLGSEVSLPTILLYLSSVSHLCSYICSLRGGSLMVSLGVVRERVV